MKTSLQLLLATLALAVSATVYAQGPGHEHSDALPGTVNEDGSIVLPDGTLFTPPDLLIISGNGTITFPDGTVVTPPPRHQPPVKNADGSITLADGTVVQPNADGTYTLPDGHVLDLTKAAPAGGPRRGHRGPPSSGG